MPSKSSYGGLALLLIAWSSPWLSAAERWTQYTNFSGIQALADGGRHLWMATPGGLVRMDKVTGEKAYFNQANSALPDSRIYALACDPSGRLAAITRTGLLVEFADGAWSNLGASVPLLGEIVLDVGWTPDGGLWVLAVDADDRLPYLVFKRGGQWNRFGLEGANSVPNYGGYAASYSPYSGTGYFNSNQPYLQVDGQGRAWAMFGVPSGKKLLQVAPGGQVDMELIPTHLNPMLLVLDRSGTPYWLCRKSIAKHAADGSWDTLAYPEGVSPPVSRHPRNVLARTPDGSEYWALSRLMRRSEGAWKETYVPFDSPSAPYPLLVQEACAGNAAEPQWPCVYTSRGALLSFFMDGDWSNVSIARTPLAGASFQSILPRGTGSAEVLLSSYAGVQSLDTRTAASARLDLGPVWGPSTAGTALGETPDGTLLVSASGILARLGPGGTESLSPPDTPWIGSSHPQPGGVGYMATDIAGNVWLADGSRLLSMPGGDLDVRTWKSHRLPPPLGSRTTITGIAAHPDGSIWFAARPAYGDSSLADSPNGLLGRYDGNAWTLFGGAHHLWIGSRTTRDIRCDGDGNVWARYLDGLLQWDGKAWKEHPAAAMQPFKGIRAMAVAPDGRLWVATNLPDAMLLRWNGRWEPVAESRGAFSVSQVETMAFDRSGRLWMLLTANGLLAYDPAGATPTALPRRPGAVARAASGRASLVRRADGSWRRAPGPSAGKPWLDLRIVDLSGRTVSGP